MFVAKIIGNVWATEKHISLKGMKLLLAKPVDEMTGELNGSTQLVLDKNMGAGIGDIVLILDEGSSCRQILGRKRGPTRAIVVGIVDQVAKNGSVRKYH